MTVAELIKILGSVSPEMEVITTYDGGVFLATEAEVVVVRHDDGWGMGIVKEDHMKDDPGDKKYFLVN